LLISLRAAVAGAAVTPATAAVSMGAHNPMIVMKKSSKH
jgi:hypothetical protein